jgi:hypothetical protein
MVTARSRKLCAPHDRAATLSLYRYKIHPFNHIPLHLPLLQHQWRSVDRRSLGSESLDFVATLLHWCSSNDRGRRVWERGVDAVAKCQPYEGRSALGIRFYSCGWCQASITRAGQCTWIWSMPG